MRLFLERGYEETTVEEIAAAAGGSHMTVFRYFPTKETLVLTGRLRIALIVETIRRRPPDEPPLDSVERALTEVMAQAGGADPAQMLKGHRLLAATPSLQAALWAFWMDAQRLIAEALADRGGTPQDALTLRVAAGIACSTAATANLIWGEEEGRRPFPEILTEAFAAARTVIPSGHPMVIPSDVEGSVPAGSACQDEADSNYSTSSE